MSKVKEGVGCFWIYLLHFLGVIGWGEGGGTFYITIFMFVFVFK